MSDFNLGRQRGMGRWIDREHPDGVPREKGLDKYLRASRRAGELSEEEKAQNFEKLWG